VPSVLRARVGVRRVKRDSKIYVYGLLKVNTPREWVGREVVVMLAEDYGRAAGVLRGIPDYILVEELRRRGYYVIPLEKFVEYCNAVVRWEEARGRAES